MSMLKSVNFPTSWMTVPFGRVAPRVQNSGRPDLEPLSVFLGAGVVPRSSRDDNHNQLGEDIGKYLVVEPGDIVFNKLRTWQGGLGASRYLGIVSPAYFVCRPKQSFDPTFLQYLLLSSAYLQELTRISKWQPPSQFDISWEQLKLLPIVAPDIARQKAIAEYLDRETARIDSLIEKKRRMVELIQLRLRAITTETLDGGGESNNRGVRLRYICSINPQTAEWSKFSDDAEITFVPLEAVWPRNLDMSRMRSKHVVSTGYTRFKEGDVIVPKITPTFEGDRSTRVEHVPTFVAAGTTELHVVRPTPKSDMRYLDHIFSTHQFLDGGEANMVGVAGQKRVPDDWIRDFRVFHTDVGIQIELAEMLDQEFDRTKIMIEKSNSHIELLLEYKQGLITAAVTGELEIPEVAA